jgi:hypothetical protein
MGIGQKAHEQLDAIVKVKFNIISKVVRELMKSEETLLNGEIILWGQLFKY